MVVIKMEEMVSVDLKAFIKGQLVVVEDLLEMEVHRP